MVCKHVGCHPPRMRVDPSSSNTPTLYFQSVWLFSISTNLHLIVKKSKQSSQEAKSYLTTFIRLRPSPRTKLDNPWTTDSDIRVAAAKISIY